MTDPVVERLFAGIPEEVEKLRPHIAALEAFNQRVASDAAAPADEPRGACGAVTIFWPDVEACEAECFRPEGHGGTIHEDETLGEWDEEEQSTHYPAR